MRKKLVLCPFFWNKKAQSIFDTARKTIYWMIASFVIAMVVIGYVLILSSYKEKLTLTPAEIKAEIISLRFTNNPDCFAYQDRITDRVYPGTIDLAKWAQPRLDACYKTEEELGYRDFNFRLELASGKKDGLKTNNYFNADQFTLRRNVLIKESNGETISDELIIYVQENIPGKPRQ